MKNFIKITKVFIILSGLIYKENCAADCAQYMQKDHFNINSKLNLIKVNNQFSGSACIADNNIILFRGDSRPNDEIFKNGFQLKNTSIQALSQINNVEEWKDMLGVKSEGFTSNGISTSIDEKTAKAYTSLNCTYVIDSKGLNPISVEATVNHYEAKQNILGDEVIFIDNIPAKNIIGCKMKDNGMLIKNPNYKL